MKLNLSYPATGCQKVIEIEDETKLRPFFEKRISHEVEGDHLGDDFKGYVFKISGGNDKQGFPMLQGVLTASRVRLLFRDGMKCYRPRKRGERKRKSVRGCVVSSDLSVLNLVVVKKGPQEIPGLTDQVKPRRLGPKRASRIRKLFNLTDKDDVRQYVIRRQIVPKQAEGKEDGEEGGDKAAKVKKPYTKAPKIQRLVTPQRLQRKRERKAIKRQRYEKSRKEAEEYNKLLAQRMKEKRAVREQKLAKKRSLSRAQSQSAGDAKAAPAKKVEAKKEEPKKEAPKKADKAKKGDAKAAPAPAKKEAPKKEEPKPKKAEAKKEQPKKEAPKKAEPKKEAKKGKKK